MRVKQNKVDFLYRQIYSLILDQTDSIWIIIVKKLLQRLRTICRQTNSLTAQLSSRR